MKKTLLVGALVLALAALGTYFALGRTPRTAPGVRSATSKPPPRAEQGFRSGIFEPPREAPAFSLDGSNGKKLSVRDHLGKVVILEFGYTHCQDVCPVTLARLTDAYKQLGDAAREVQLIYVTVDPKRDSPERMREYLAAFNPTFLGATRRPRRARGGVKKPMASSPSKWLPGIRNSHTQWIIRRSCTWSIGREKSAGWCPMALQPTTSFTISSPC